MYVEHRITTTDFNDLMHAKEKKVVLKERKKERFAILTWLRRAEAAVPRTSGSSESKESMRSTAEGGRSLKVSATHRLYSC
jgi:hypothetical protein